MPLPNNSKESHRVAGVWIRAWEEDPLHSGVFDKETKVYWLQTPSGIYVDLRLPARSPGLSIETSSGYTKCPGALRANTSVSSDEINHDATTAAVFLDKTSMSFAGTLMCALGDTSTGTALEKDFELAKLVKKQQPEATIPLCTCFWQRHVDFQPPSTSLDVGICCAATTVQETDGSIYMRETGVNADYAELWHRLGGSENGPFMALELQEEVEEANGGITIKIERRGFWVRVGDHFAYAIGRPTAGCNIVTKVGSSLADALKDEETTGSALNKAFTYIAVYGQIQQNGEWRIESSLRPDLVGCSLLGPKDATNCCSTLTTLTDKSDNSVGTVVQTLVGPNQTQLFRKWRVVELSDDCTLPLFE